MCLINADLDHVALLVQHGAMDEAIAFLTEIFGGSLLKREVSWEAEGSSPGGYVRFIGRNFQANIQLTMLLVKDRYPILPGVHIGFRVVDAKSAVEIIEKWAMEHFLDCKVTWEAGKAFVTVEELFATRFEIISGLPNIADPDDILAGA